MHATRGTLGALALAACLGTPVGAQGWQRLEDVPRPRRALWGTATVGLTGHDFRCGGCRATYLSEDVGSVVTLAGGVRVRRVLVGAMHREWQAWLDDGGSRGSTLAGMAGFVVVDDGHLAIVPYVALGSERFRPNGERAERHDHAAMLGGLSVVIFPAYRVSMVLGYDRQVWLRGMRLGPEVGGASSSQTASIGITMR